MWMEYPHLVGTINQTCTLLIIIYLPSSCFSRKKILERSLRNDDVSCPICSFSFFYCTNEWLAVSCLVTTSPVDQKTLTLARRRCRAYSDEISVFCLRHQQVTIVDCILYEWMSARVQFGCWVGASYFRSHGNAT